MDSVSPNILAKAAGVIDPYKISLQYSLIMQNLVLILYACML